jgi:hypothetical protein
MDQFCPVFTPRTFFPFNPFETTLPEPVMKYVYEGLADGNVVTEEPLSKDASNHKNPPETLVGVNVEGAAGVKPPLYKSNILHDRKPSETIPTEPNAFDNVYL